MDEETKRTRKILVFFTILYLILLLPMFILAVSSIFLFDSPGSEKSPLTVAFAISLVGTPLLTILSMVAAWILYGLKNNRAPKIVILVPFLGILAIIVSIVFIETFCDGYFSCFNPFS